MMEVDGGSVLERRGYPGMACFEECMLLVPLWYNVKLLFALHRQDVQDLYSGHS